MKNNNILRKICVLALGISFLLNNLVFAEVATTSIVVTNNDLAEPTIKFNDNFVDVIHGWIDKDSGLTKSQIEAMSMTEGAIYFIQRYPNHPCFSPIIAPSSMQSYAVSLFAYLCRQVLEEEFPKVFSNDANPDGLHWNLVIGKLCRLTLNEYTTDRQLFILKEQEVCNTFAEIREYVKDCDKILREKGYY